MARIALDAMGGDFAPQATVAGALHALRDLDPALHVVLVGQTAIIEATLAELLAGEFADLDPAARARLSIVEAPDVIGMSERPTVALKASKANSSMVVGLKLQTDGRADAFVSAGNTGAQMAASTVILRLHQGLSRPAIAALFPTALLPVVVLDGGANVDCSAEELVSFARLGSVYAEDILGRTNPSIGLLSIGEEPEKGNALVKEANALLEQAKSVGLNFQGNIEGRDVPAGASGRGPIDVVICDGFVGNVMLKFYESLAQVLIRMIADGAGLDKAALRSTFKHLDHSEQGGAPLLGVKGVSIIAHGSANAIAIKNAIRVAVLAVESRMNEHIGRRLAGETGEAAAPPRSSPPAAGRAS